MPKQTDLIILRDLLKKRVIFESTQNALKGKAQLPIGPDQYGVTIEIVALSKENSH